jgi:hypothetical protein
MNSDLYGKTVTIPEEVVGYLNQCFEQAKHADETTEGYKRNQELREKQEITYQQLKRMKNWFDNFNGHDNDLPFILNGGHYVKEWVDNTLRSMRDGVDLSKEIKSEVLPNQYIDPHQKNDVRNMNRPSKSHSRPVDNYNIEITENLKRINDLIKKLI